MQKLTGLHLCSDRIYDLQRDKTDANTQMQVMTSSKTLQSLRHGSANPPMDVL